MDGECRVHARSTIVMYRKNAYVPPAPGKLRGRWPIVLGASLVLIAGCAGLGWFLARSAATVSAVAAGAASSRDTGTPRAVLVARERDPIGGMAALDGPTHGVSTWVYWTVPSRGEVLRTPWDSARPEVVSRGEAHPADMIAAEFAVLWVDEGARDDAGRASGASIRRSTYYGGPVDDVVLGHVATGSRLAFAAGTLYWTDPSADEIDAMTLDTKVRTPVRTIVAHAGLSSSATLDLALDATNVYWASGDAIMAAPVSGGTPVELARSVRPSHLFARGDALFWRRAGGLGTGHGPSVERLDLSPAGAKPVIVVEEISGGVTNVDDPLVIDPALSSSFMRGGAEHVSTDRQSVFWVSGDEIFTRRFDAAPRR